MRKYLLIIISIICLMPNLFSQNNVIRIDTNNSKWTGNVTLFNNNIYGLTTTYSQNKFGILISKHIKKNSPNYFINDSLKVRIDMQIASNYTSTYCMAQNPKTKDFVAVGYQYINNFVDSGLFWRFDTNLHVWIDKSISVSSSNKLFLNAVIPIDSNTIAIGGNTQIADTINQPTNFCLLKTDYDGNIIQQDTFASKGLERFINMEKDEQNNMYMSGVYIRVWAGKDVQNVVKKISPTGQLLVDKYLPYRRNSTYGVLLKLNPGNVHPKFVYLNMMRKEPHPTQYGNLTEDGDTKMRMTFMDENLNIYKTIDTFDNTWKSIRGARLLKNGNLILFGIRVFVPNGQGKWYGWFRQIDTNGAVLWDRDYQINDSADCIFTDLQQDVDGSLYLSGSAFANTEHKQGGFIIKVDSNGCLDSTYCYPLGIHEVKSLAKGQLLLYPNPASQNITLQIPNTQYQGGQAIIYGIDGKIVHTIPHVQATQNIPISQLAPGNYWLHYMVGEWSGYVQFVVQ